MNRLKELREQMGIKQTDLAEMLSVARTTISGYELEQRSLTPDLIVRLCQIFNVTSDYLLGLSDMPTASVSEEEAALIRAYRRADDRARQMVELALEPFAESPRGGAAVV